VIGGEHAHTLTRENTVREERYKEENKRRKEGKETMPEKIRDRGRWNREVADRKFGQLTLCDNCFRGKREKTRQGQYQCLHAQMPHAVENRYLLDELVERGLTSLVYAGEWW
jgi:hypothetical protein